MAANTDSVCNMDIDISGGEPEYVKVMLWDSASGMKPLALTSRVGIIDKN